MRKVLKIPIQKQLKPDDYLQKQIPVFDEIENFIQDFFPENNKQLSVAAFRWFEEWRNWKELQVLEAPNSWNASSGLSISLYMLVRLVKPSLVVETGTANGASAAAISAALEANNKGVLHTFDVYDFDLSLVPIHSRTRIVKHRIKRRNSLAVWMRDNHALIDSSSIFLHDSNHSYEHQKWEYSLAKRFGFSWILSDDVDDSQAFIEILDGRKSVLVDGDKLIGFFNSGN